MLIASSDGRWAEDSRTRVRFAVQVVAVGSGAALRMGAEGNADVLVSHDPKGEQELVASGAAVARTPIMENYFVIAGPREDPAKVAQATDPAAGFRAIAAAKAPYVSRGDDSGTHRKEKQLLAAAGLDAAKPWEGFTSTGAGMGLTLQVAGERRAYVLSDIGTFLAYRERTRLERLSKDSPELRNEYSIIVVTHNKGTMAACERLYGITMEEPGVSKLISVRLERQADYRVSASVS